MIFSVNLKILSMLQYMKIMLIVTGKTDAEWLQQGLEVYIKRLGFYGSFELKILPDIKNAKNLSFQEHKEKEAEQLFPFLEGKNEIILLDEKGTVFSSQEFARFMEIKLISGCRKLIFIVGGPYGFSERIVKKSTGMISLSKLTFSHQMVRLLFLEQLYRAFTIIRGEPYHHD
jgi:23S rRNA (pseudouridine1915-N3)-methyltransferase